MNGLNESFTRPVEINRYECEKCGWYADIPNDKSQAYFSTEICPECGRKLKKLERED